MQKDLAAKALALRDIPKFWVERVEESAPRWLAERLLGQVELKLVARRLPAFAATAAAAAAAAAAGISARLCFVDFERAAAHIRFVQS